MLVPRKIAGTSLYTEMIKCVNNNWEIIQEKTCGKAGGIRQMLPAFKNSGMAFPSRTATAAPSVTVTDAEPPVKELLTPSGKVLVSV